MSPVRRCILSTILLFAPPAALATLGQAASTALANGTASNQARQLRGANGAQVRDQSIVTPSGIAVHEFSSGGVIFAIRWSGTRMPDLSRLLGTYFPQYIASMKARGPDRRRAPAAIHSGGLVVHTGGHMRAYHGSAYLPGLVPPGVDLQSLGVQP